MHKLTANNAPMLLYPYPSFMDAIEGFYTAQWEFYRVDIL